MSRAEPRVRRHSVVEVVLILVVAGYAGLLLVGPLVAIVWGALSHGLSAILRELTSESALNALWLTIVLSVAAMACLDIDDGGFHFSFSSKGWTNPTWTTLARPPSPMHNARAWRRSTIRS